MELTRIFIRFSNMIDHRPSHPKEVENYTTAFLASFGVLVFVFLFAIWAIWGLLMAGLIGWIADRLMTVDFGRSKR